MTISELWHNGTEADWKEVIAYYWQRVRGNPKRAGIEEKLSPSMEEPHTSKILERIEQYDGKAWFDFLHNDYFLWIFKNKMRIASCRKHLLRYVHENKLDELLQIRDKLLKIDRREILQSLCLVKEIHGMGTVGAAGLLSLMYPDDFGAVDQFVVRALQKVAGIPEHDKLMKIKPTSINRKNAVLLIEIYRAKAAENNRTFKSGYWTPRAIDQVLDIFDKKIAAEQGH
jgi:hypothetical protein